MANRSIVPEILAVLEPWLDAREAEWRHLGTPTLPLTRDGKVNVRAITVSLGLKESQEQHFFRHAALHDAVNRVAFAQGIKPIKSRVGSDDGELGAGGATQAENDRARKLERRVNELERQNEALRAETYALREKLKRYTHLEIHMIQTGRIPR